MYWTGNVWYHNPHIAAQSTSRATMESYYHELVGGSHHVALVLIEFTHHKWITTVHRILELKVKEKESPV